MFITNPSLQHWTPAPLREPEHQYWRAFILSMEGPWYLLRHRISTEQGSYIQTIAVAWEPTLVDIAEQLGPDEVSSLCRLSSRLGAWVLREISEVWVAADDEADETGRLLLKLKDESFLRDTLLEHQVGLRQGRHLLLRTHDERAAEHRSGAT
jgi:hypothetical protein